MKTKILLYSELKDLPGYEDLCETSYNTLVEVVDKIIPKVKELNLSCNMKSYGGYQDLSEDRINIQNECGTSACIMGVIATLFPAERKYFLKYNLGFSYIRFQRDRIPELFEKEVAADEWSMWYFLFSETWPNSFKLGVERIKDVLSGQYNENWNYDWHLNI